MLHRCSSRPDTRLLLLLPLLTILVLSAWPVRAATQTTELVPAAKPAPSAVPNERISVTGIFAKANGTVSQATTNAAALVGATLMLSE